MAKLIAVVFEVGKPGAIREIEGSLESFYQVLGAETLAVLRIPELGRRVCAYIDDEALLTERLWNRTVRGQRIAGTFFVVDVDDEGNDLSLTPSQAVATLAYFEGKELTPMKSSIDDVPPPQVIVLTHEQFLDHFTGEEG